MNPVLAQKVNSGPGRRPYRTAGAGQAPKVFTLILKSRLRSDVPKAPAFVPVGTRQESGLRSKTSRKCSTWNTHGRRAQSWKRREAR